MRLNISVVVLALSLFAATAQATAPDSFRFDIPEGPLDAAVASFERVTGLRVTVPRGIALEVFTTPGASGVLTA